MTNSLILFGAHFSTFLFSIDVLITAYVGVRVHFSNRCIVDRCVSCCRDVYQNRTLAVVGRLRNTVQTLSVVGMLTYKNIIGCKDA